MFPSCEGHRDMRTRPAECADAAQPAAHSTFRPGHRRTHRSQQSQIQDCQEPNAQRRS